MGQLNMVQTIHAPQPMTGKTERTSSKDPEIETSTHGAAIGRTKSRAVSMIVRRTTCGDHATDFLQINSHAATKMEAVVE